MSIFLDNEYVLPLKGKGYIRVDRMLIPDGSYFKTGGGYCFNINTPDGHSVGYAVITNTGIRGMFRDSDQVLVKDGIPMNEDVYMIMTIQLNHHRDDKINKILE